METSSSADGYDHHGPQGRYDEEVSFYSVNRTLTRCAGSRRLPQALGPKTKVRGMAKHLSKTKACLELVALFERNGYVRTQNAGRIATEGAQMYKKGSEVRIIARSATELERVRELLNVLGFVPGRPFAKGRQFCIPIYGREQVSTFMELAGKHCV